MAITLTSRAACELKELMAAQDRMTSALRVWVQGGGCSGYSYGMALDDSEPEGDDQVFEQEGVRIYVDGLSLGLIDGSTVDFVDDDMGGGFKVDNPNAVGSCGCGSSFKTAEGGGGGGCGGCSSRG
jgi:iron-sulfur cluster assembly protein